MQYQSHTNVEHSTDSPMLCSAMYMEPNVCVDCLRCMRARLGTLTGLQNPQTSIPENFFAIILHNKWKAK